MSRVYVDSDGVLANFNKAFAPAFGLEYPTKTVLYHDWPMQASNTASASEFYRICERHPTLWESAEPYPWTSAIIQVLDLKDPEWMILTSATHDPECWSGKVKWFTHHLTESSLNKLVMVSGRKWRIASKGDILIDDRYENVEGWREAGGVAYHWIDYTEDLTELARDQIDRLSSFLDEQLGLPSSSLSGLTNGKISS